MIWLAALALAQATPAKLVIIYGNAPATVVAYPSMNRCQAARRSLMAQIEAETARTKASIPPGMPAILTAPSAHCIPG